MDLQSQNHPLLLELNSLKSALTRFQDEAHTSAVRLQRHSLDRSNTHERAVTLERENHWLKAEIAILRANPTTSPLNSTVEQVQQLTLSLRRLSEKLTLTEDALSTKTTELAQANADLLKARLAVENAYELGARVRGREEAAKIRENELQWRLKSAEEEKKISEVAVSEYANLVRSMEARMGLGLGSTSTLVSHRDTMVEEDSEKPHSGDTLANSLVEGKLGLKRLIFDLHSDTKEQLRQLGQLQGELEVVKSNYEAERKGTHILHLELGKAQAELHMLKIDDNTAARMVSRYMQFSQTSTNALQSTLSALKTRHTATLSTLTSTSYSLASSLRSAENTIERLRTSLDELGRDIMKETYGRRREVALRVKLLGREEKILEGLRRWLRKGEEAVSDAKNEADDGQNRIRVALLGMTQDARILSESLDDGLVTDSASLSGSLARVVLAQGLADGLVEELKMETARRMDLEKAILQEQDTTPPIVTPNDSDIDQRRLVSDTEEYSPITVHRSEKQPDTPTLVSYDTTALDTPSPKAEDDLIPSDSANDTVIIAKEDSPPPSHARQSDDLNPNQVPASVLPESLVAAEPFPAAVPLSLSSSTLPDIVIDAAVAQPLHIWAETVLGEETDVAVQNNDLLVGPSSVPVVVEQVELVIDDSASSVLPYPPSDLYSVVVPMIPSNISPTGQPPVLAEQKPKIPTPHPLLAELAKISHRYDDFQRSFRDCHLALEGLRASLEPSSTTTFLNHRLNRPTGDKPPELTLTPIIPIDILHAAVSRLDDYTEDVRVEVEIRISDEEVLAKGYEVLLCVPGALYSSSASEPLLPSLQANRDERQLHHDQPQFSSQSYSDYDENEDLDSSSLPPTQSELEIQVQAFITGTDPSVTKACEGFSKKLEDVQHDIAVLKRAIHDPDPGMVGDEPELSSQTPTTPGSGSRGWASWIRSPSGPPFSASAATASVKNFGLSPTFGGIMTSPHRLNHSQSLQRSSSATFVNGNGSSWMQGAGGGRRGGKDDILGRLGLRVPMPIFDSAMPPLSSSIGQGWNGLSPTMSISMKQRSVSSTTYMLGLGSSPMMAAALSRATSIQVGPQKGDHLVAMGVNHDVDPVNEMSSGGPIGLVDVRRGVKDDVEHEMIDTGTEPERDEQNGDVE